MEAFIVKSDHSLSNLSKLMTIQDTIAFLRDKEKCMHMVMVKHVIL